MAEWRKERNEYSTTLRVSGARCYLYKIRPAVVSLASSAALPMCIAPTLTLYYDALFRLFDERELLAGDLRICRLVGDAWLPLPTYLPAGYPFAVAPLTLETAGTLVAESA